MSVQNCLLDKEGELLIKGCSNSRIPSSVKIIGTAAFYNCTKLTSIRIPNRVLTIDNSAFYGCTGLLSIEIPESVLDFGYKPFECCTGLKEIRLHGKAPDETEQLIRYAGLEDLNNITLYVPIGTGYAYRHNDYFSQFKEILPVL